MDKEKLHDIDSKDPQFHAKATSIQSNNQIVALIKENKKDIYDKLYYVFSLYFAIITTLYSQQSLSYLYFFIMSNLFILFLIYPAYKFYFRRRDLAKNKDNIEKRLKEFGIKLK